jgi:capsular polysaccharide biosynthesis protein
MDPQSPFGVIQRHIVAVVLVTILVATVAFLVSLVLPKTYEGEASLLLYERPTGSTLAANSVYVVASQPERAVQTVVELAQTRASAASAVASLGLNVTPEDLLSNVSVTARQSTNVISIRVTDRDPKQAASIANALAADLVKTTMRDQRDFIDISAKAIQERLKATEPEFLALTRAAAATKTPDARVESRQGLQVATSTRTYLMQRLESLRAAQSTITGPVRIVSPAAPSATPVAPKPIQAGVLGLFAGLVVGVCFAFVIDLGIPPSDTGSGEESTDENAAPYRTRRRQAVKTKATLMVAGAVVGSAVLGVTIMYLVDAALVRQVVNALSSMF